MRIAITLFPGVEELDAIAPYEVFGVARSLGLDLIVDLVTHIPSGNIQAFHGLHMTRVIPLTDDMHYDLMIVPGGAWISGERSGVRLAVEEGILTKILRARHERGTILASVCTGAFLLAEAGVLQGHPATTHHKAIKMLREHGIEVIQERVVDAGSILSCGGITSGLDLSLWIIERFFSSEASRKAEDQLEYKRQGQVYAR